MTEEEYFIKNYPDFCYGDRPLSPHWDLFEYGVEFGERQSEKKIAELEQKNAQLKEANETLATMNNNMWVELEMKRAESQGIANKLHQLIKAKEYIRELLDFIKAKENGDDRIPTPYFYEEYEQFLKECK